MTISPPIDAFTVPEEEDFGSARLRTRTRRAFVLIAVLIFGFFGLGAILKVGGAVVGSGEVTVDSSVRTISHATGGVLTALLVRDGDHVTKDQILMRLDTSVSKVGSQSASTGLDQLLARRARLQAERDQASAIQFPPELVRGASGLDTMASERRLFNLRREERRGTLSLLGDRIRQYESQIRSFEVQIEATERQIVLIQPELAGLRKLYARQLVPINRINQMERTAVQLEGSKAALESNIAEARAHISETREQMLNVDKSARSDAGNALAEVSTQINEQQLRSASAGDTFARSVIRAPQSGVVDRIAFTTIGSAVPAAQPILQLVPDRDRLVVEAKVRPQDIDQLRIGQSARVVFSGLERQTTPDIPAKVIFLSPDQIQDSRTGQTYYRIRVQLDAKGMADAPQIALKAGMPAEVFVQTGDRSILSFLMKPLFDQLRHAFREG
ncbi:MAG: HlyD family type I secretion periplasmic adaptor subunit [Sphingomonas sp.]|jgi:HlyD family type I secretion membrane fusion protein